MRQEIQDQIEVSREKIAGRGWDHTRYVRHYVSDDDLLALAEEMVKGVPPHIARTKRMTIDGVEVRALEVMPRATEKKRGRG